MPKIIIPKDPLEFIRKCVRERRCYWTYHINMRMEERYIPRKMIMESTQNYEIIEAYPKDKYLPSYLIYSRHGKTVFHVLVAVDVKNDNIRIITAYCPEAEKWNAGFKRRRTK